MLRMHTAYGLLCMQLRSCTTTVCLFACADVYLTARDMQKGECAVKSILGGTNASTGNTRELGLG